MVFFTVQFLSIHIDPIQLVVFVHPIIWALQQADASMSTIANLVTII